MFLLNFQNHYWVFLRSKLIMWRRKIATQMFLCRRNPNSILIVNKFNFHNFKYLMWVFGQALIINIPLLNTKIGHLQGKGQFLFLFMRNSSPTHHRVFHCKNIQKRWFFIFPPFCLRLYKKNTIDIIVLFCATLRMSCKIGSFKLQFFLKPSLFVPKKFQLVLST